MIIDLEKFIREEQPVWRELERWVHRLEAGARSSLDLAGARRVHYLYERTASDLARLNTFAFDPETKRYLESLIGRAYALIHDARPRTRRVAPYLWFCGVLPRTFRRRWRAFALAAGAVLLGAVFGAAVITVDPGMRSVLLPFHHLHVHPSERVAEEERRPPRALEDHRASFSATLITHNTRVAIFSMALGIAWGIGTLVLLFYNGVIIGAVAADYMLAGETRFLLGWLLPHGAVEIPAFLIAGQAGLVLAGTMIGRGSRTPLGQRLRNRAGELATLIGGVAILLVWAGIVEAFFSQYHEPILPYSLKILFGLAELILLCAFLGGCGRHRRRHDAAVSVSNSHSWGLR